MVLALCVGCKILIAFASSCLITCRRRCYARNEQVKFHNWAVNQMDWFCSLIVLSCVANKVRLFFQWILDDLAICLIAEFNRNQLIVVMICYVMFRVTSLTFDDNANITVKNFVISRGAKVRNFHNIHAFPRSPDTQLIRWHLLIVFRTETRNNADHYRHFLKRTF